MEFAQNLQNAMEEKQVTKYWLAKQLGVHQTTIKNWVDGKTEPKFEMKFKIAAVLGVPVYQLDPMFQIDPIVVDRSGSRELNEFLDRIANDVSESIQTKLKAEGFVEEEDFIDSKYILNFFEMLNDEGKIEATKYVERLTRLDEYKKADDNSDEEGQKKEKTAD